MDDVDGAVNAREIHGDLDVASIDEDGRHLFFFFDFLIIML